MLADVVGGQIPAGIDTHIELLELNKSGRIRVLATAGATRSALMPDVPTMREVGFPQVEGAGWYAFYAPAKTPPATIAALNKAIIDAQQLPDVKQRLTQLGVEVKSSTPEELSKLMATESAKWAPVIKASGFKGD
jgi:tripartite-type tricarboxylate transporter receptor subunit TctC